MPPGSKGKDDPKHLTILWPLSSLVTHPPWCFLLCWLRLKSPRLDLACDFKISYLRYLTLLEPLPPSHLCPVSQLLTPSDRRDITLVWTTPSPDMSPTCTGHQLYLELSPCKWGNCQCNLLGLICTQTREWYQKSWHARIPQAPFFQR